MSRRYDLKVANSVGVLTAMKLANDQNGFPLWKTHLLDPIQPSAQIGEPSYASFSRKYSGVYTQGDLSGGAGKKTQVPISDPDNNRYYYTEWMDWSIQGQGQKGPAVTTLTTPADMGTLVGYFEIFGVPFLVGSRKIAYYLSAYGSLTEILDAGSNVLGSAATYSQLALETKTSSANGDADQDAVASADHLIAQQVRSATAGPIFLSKVGVKLVRIGLATPVGGVAANVGATGSTTYTYKVTAVDTNGDETDASPGITTTTGNATLTSTNYNTVTPTAVTNAVAYNVYRTSGGATQGKIGSILPARGATGGTLLDQGLVGDGTTPSSTNGTGKIPGDCRLRIVGDLAGKPNLGDVWATARMLAKNIPTTATVMSFKFDLDTTVAVEVNEPFWLVMDCASSTLDGTIAWRRDSGLYSLGASATTTDGGNSWVDGSTNDYYFDLYTKSATTTVYVGKSTSNAYVTTTTGSTYTSDSLGRVSSLFATVGNRVIRNLDGQGAIVTSEDGTNWSDPLIVGDVSTPLTAMVVRGDTLFICKTDSIWACNVLATDQALAPIDYASPSSTNGQGACEFKGNVYVPFSGRLVEISGDFSNGFVVNRSVGPEAMPEWDFPHGVGRVVAVAGDRFNLYAVFSASDGYRLYKSSDPSKARWHGSIATIGDGTQTVQAAFVSDLGGTNSPHLFVTTTGNAVADIVLSRVPNPANDPNYLYDISTVGDTYLPRATGLLWVNPKSWLLESVTFQQTRSGDYVDVLYDTLDGEGWRRIADKGGRVYSTGVMRYPAGENSLVLARRVRLSNNIATQSPIILAVGLTYAVRPIQQVPLRSIEFTVLAEDNLGSNSLGDTLPSSGETIDTLFDEASLASGTRTVVSPFGKRYDSVLILDSEPTLLDLLGSDDHGLQVIKVTAAQVS